MDYCRIYEVLERRRRDDRRFVYDDYSGRRSAPQKRGRNLGPLWIVARDPSGGRRLWIIQKPGGIEISAVRRDKRGLDHEQILSQMAATPVEAAELLEKLF